MTDAELLDLLARMTRAAGWIPISAVTSGERLTLTAVPAGLLARVERLAEVGDEL